MANIENLKPSKYKLSLEEAKKGGINSGIARRRKKALKEELIALLEVLDEKGHSVQEKISFALIKEASKGNVRAFEVIRDTIGEKEPETVNIGKNSPADELLKSIDELKEKN